MFFFNAPLKNSFHCSPQSFRGKFCLSECRLRHIFESNFVLQIIFYLAKKLIVNQAWCTTKAKLPTTNEHIPHYTYKTHKTSQTTQHTTQHTTADTTQHSTHTHTFLMISRAETTCSTSQIACLSYTFLSIASPTIFAIAVNVFRHLHTTTIRSKLAICARQVRKQYSFNLLIATPGCDANAICVAITQKQYILRVNLFSWRHHKFQVTQILQSNKSIF